MEVEEAVRPAQPRMQTPPPIQMEEEGTPRSEAGKRKAKGDPPRVSMEEWQPSNEEIRSYVAGIQLCVKCWEHYHLFESCPKGEEGDVMFPKGILTHPNFQQYLHRWQMNRKKRGVPWLLESHQVADTVVVPPYCTDCMKLGHKSKDEVCPKK
jgi:hypothetical protein